MNKNINKSRCWHFANSISLLLPQSSFHQILFCSLSAQGKSFGWFVLQTILPSILSASGSFQFIFSCLIPLNFFLSRSIRNHQSRSVVFLRLTPHNVKPPRSPESLPWPLPQAEWNVLICTLLSLLILIILCKSWTPEKKKMYSIYFYVPGILRAAE